MGKVYMPAISVVLPVYNGDLYLKESIDSILHQTFQDFELIIVDDFSSDKTAEIAIEYANITPKISYIRNASNIKLPLALNEGFNKASGRYWTWTSCDNLYLPNAFAVLSAALDKNSSVGMVYSSMEIIDEAGKSMVQVNAGPADDLILRNVVGASFLYRADIAKKIGGYSKEKFLCEDYEYWFRLACNTTIAPLPIVLYKYRQHQKSLSALRQQEIISKGILLQKYYYPYFVKTRTKAALFYTYLRARDIYNPWRHLYLFIVLWYNPVIFLKEMITLVSRRMKKFEKN